ncbi:MAG: hypothetical protein HYW50_03580, partial [Candidatus Diapherotrites archaeon]|nr:hypothetical protein [Candidatus Diapherotrites archaeon]
MELFRISFGPWEKLFEGMLEKNPVELYSNPDSVLLVLVFEKHGAQIEGVVIEMFKALNVEGEIESFIDTLPTEIVLLTKHDKKQTLKFLLIASNPSYSEWEEEKFGNETDELMKKLEANTTTIKDLSKAYGLHLQEISKAGLKVKKAFFSEPLLVPALSTSYAGYSAQPTTTSGKTFVKGEFILGLTKERQQIVEPLELFLKTLVTGGEKNERLHFLHILSESFLLSNISLVVFDPLGYFSGINLPTKNLAELARYKVEAEPIGFPIKVFKPVNQIKVDLNFISPAGFGEILGFGKGPVTDIIAAALLKNSVEGIEDLIEKIKLSPLTEDINAFELKRTVRILTLINRNYPGMFDGKNDTEDITTSGTRTLGRAGIIDLKGIEPKICFLIVHNILSSIIK